MDLKKIVVLVLSLVMVLSFTGCFNRGPAPEEDSDDSSHKPSKVGVSEKEDEKEDKKDDKKDKPATTNTGSTGSSSNSGNSASGGTDYDHPNGDYIYGDGYYEDANGVPILNWYDDMSAYEGAYIAVDGPVVDWYEDVNDSDIPLVLNLGVDSTDPFTFNVLIYPEDLDYFPWDPAYYYLYEDVRVYGTLTLYNGIYEIRVYDTDDIFIL